MLLYCGLGIIIVGLLILLGALWFGRIQSGRLFFAAGGTILLVGAVVTQLFDVQKLVFKSGEKEAYSFELQRVERAAQQVQTDAAEVRQTKEQIEALVKRVEKSEQDISLVWKAIEEAGQAAADVQKQQAQRTLTAEQKQFLVKTLSPFRGQKARVSCIQGDVEGCQFARDFPPVLLGAGWDLGGGNPGVSQAIYGKNPIGIEVTISPKDKEVGSIPPATQVLVASLVQFGLSKREGFLDQAVEAGVIDLRIGGKPSPS